jgi:hypothetical protein
MLLPPLHPSDGSGACTTLVCARRCPRRRSTARADLGRARAPDTRDHHGIEHMRAVPVSRACSRGSLLHAHACCSCVIRMSYVRSCWSPLSRLDLRCRCSIGAFDCARDCIGVREDIVYMCVRRYTMWDTDGLPRGREPMGGVVRVRGRVGQRPLSQSREHTNTHKASESASIIRIE